MRGRVRTTATAIAATAIAAATGAAVSAGPANAASHQRYVAPPNTKIDVMGEWAHPDDDTSIVGPCGVWHQRYKIRCGIIQVTRGEGGGNAVGTEQGPALGLRRENEDRTAHYRSGTIDIFNLDRVDFFYNQSAPLTARLWNDHATLGRIVRIIRQTQPEIYIGFTPSLAAGHGNHQEAGRYIWEGFKDAADPSKFPGQLKGPHALSTWQVKKIFSGATTSDSSANGYEAPTGTGGTTTSRNCTTGFRPSGIDDVAGVWEGYASPYTWPAGNIQHRPAGSPKSWAQVAQEGSVAYPTQSRVMFQGVAKPDCSRFAMTDNVVPFQPNVLPSGKPNPAAGDDGAILDGATRRDPGGTPLGTLEYLTFSDFYEAPGTPFTATLHVRSGKGTLAAGRVALHVPAGWRVDRASKAIGAARTGATTTVRFRVTPPRNAKVETDYRISAMWTTGTSTGYTDQVVQTVPPAEGRFQRFGNWREYDHWLAHVAPQADRLGRSQAVQSVGAGHALTVPVVVHNWSDRTQRGRVSLVLPRKMSADAAAKPYGPLKAGASTTVRFRVSNSYTDDALPSDQTVSIPITTTNSDPTGAGTDTLSLAVVPRTTIPTVATAPTVDGRADAAYADAPKLDIGRVWQDATGCKTAADCGLSTGKNTDHSYAQVVQSGGALYFFTHIRDDYQAYAVTPAECFAHWESDSVEFQIDPRGNSSRRLTDTGSTFKLGVFPYTNDPHNTNGNGVNGPCWERDADQHYGFSTGPLARTVRDAPNASGVQVATTARWVGSNSTTVDHAYTGGGYDLEVKIPLADLPARPDLHHMGLNITPYDNDNTAAAGTTQLRHIDMSTRLGWSAFGSVQSDPYHWGSASIAGYTPAGAVARLPTTSPAPIVSHSNLDGTQSPETIAQSARDGVPISGRAPAPAGDRIGSVDHSGGPRRVTLTLHATGAGTAQVYLWAGDVHSIPVWTTSCPLKTDPAPDHGFSSCKQSDGGIPPWGTNMSGRIVAQRTLPLRAGVRRVTFSLPAAAARRVAAGGRALVSFETPHDQVQAIDVALGPRRG